MTAHPMTCPHCGGTRRLLIVTNGIEEEVNCGFCTGAATEPEMLRPTVVPGKTPQPVMDLYFDEEDTMKVPIIPPSSRVPADLFVWIRDEGGVEHCVHAEPVE